MAVEQAVNTNPDVSAQRLPRSRRRGGRSAWGAYLPRIDLNAIDGQDRDRIAGTSRTLNRQQGG